MPVEGTEGEAVVAAVVADIAVVVFVVAVDAALQSVEPVRPLYSVEASSSVLEGLICRPLHGLRSRMVNRR